MNAWTVLACWVTTLALQAVFIALSARKSRGGITASLWLSIVASVPALMTLVLFLVVFVIGRSSNVAQIAGDEGFGLWRLWCTAWPLLFFLNPVALLVSLLAVVLPPYSPFSWTSIAARVNGVVPAAFGWYAVLRWFPDA